MNFQRNSGDRALRLITKSQLIFKSPAILNGLRLIFFRGDNTPYSHGTGHRFEPYTTHQ